MANYVLVHGGWLITEARKFGLGMILASQMSEHFSEEVRANAATWLVLKPMDVREAKKNAPNVQVDPEDLIRDRPSSSARRIQVRRLETTRHGPECSKGMAELNGVAAWSRLRAHF